ncbi:MAG TPA: MBL fold metallo-hydrolase [Ruminiclostridium sp.]|nr:MBL fold metallo-hydrolase [Ruminiclostridium sp.]
MKNFDTPDYTLTQITDNVYAYVDIKNGSEENSFGSNAGIIIGRDGIAVVDTRISAKEAKRFINAIRAVSEKPIKYVINTHYHHDHSFGNSEFVKLGATVIAQENSRQSTLRTAEAILRNPEQCGLTPEYMEGTTVAYPALSFGDFMTIDLGDQVIELRHARHSHTDGDTLVYLPDKKVLFTGDVLFTNYHVFLGEGNIEEWCNELDEMMNMDVEIIIPGHGAISGKKDIEHMKNYILQFDQLATKLVTIDADIHVIADEMLRVLPQRAENVRLIKENLMTKYQQR